MKEYRITVRAFERTNTYTVLADSADNALYELEGSDYLADYTENEIEELEIVDIEEVAE